MLINLHLTFKKFYKLVSNMRVLSCVLNEHTSFHKLLYLHIVNLLIQPPYSIESDNFLEENMTF